MTPSTERADRRSTTDRPASTEGQEDLTRALEPAVAWASRVSGLPVVHDWPDAQDAGASAAHDSAASQDKQGVVLYPFALEPVAAPASLALRARGAEVTLRVLVTATGEPQDIAAVIAALALDAALAELNVETGPVDLALWQALGRRPAPAFVLAIPVRRSLDSPAAPPVRSRRLVVADPDTARGALVDAPPAAADDLTVTPPSAGTAPGASATPLPVPSTSTH